MRFLKALFLVVVAFLLTTFTSANRHDVTINLWDGIQVDIKLWLLLGLMFLIGFLPPFLVLRARLWALKRRLGVHERATAHPLPESAEREDQAPVI